MRFALGLVVMVSAQTTHAETRLGVSLSVNSPSRWHDNGAFGASILVGLGSRHGIRASAATYEPGYALRTMIDPIMPFDAGLGGGRGGQASLGWQYYTGWFGIETNTSGGTWRGFFIDLGAQVRHDDVWYQPFWDIGERERYFTRRTGGGAKGLLGFSWTQYHVFVSVALGMSLGVYRGTDRHETYFEDPYTERTSEEYVRLEPAVEGFTRLGIAFGI